jgi:holo-[acyl-carrier protein] synthase
MTGCPQARGSEALLTHLDVGQLWEPVLKPMLIGSIPPGLFTGDRILCPHLLGCAGFSDPRKSKLAARAKARIQELAAARAERRLKRQKRVIIGIGSDLIDIRRIEETLERHGERFTARCFTDVERARQIAGRTGPPPMPNGSRPRRLAPRRLEPGCPRACSGGTWVWSISPAEKPTMQLTGGAAERLQSMVPDEHDSAPFI